MTEAVVIVVHAGEQACGGCRGVGTICLAGRDPPAIQVEDELPEAAAGVIELLDLHMARGQESLVQGDGARRIAVDELGNPGRDLLEVTHERGAGDVRDEGAGLQRAFDLVFHGVRRSAGLSRHFPCSRARALSGHQGAAVGGDRWLADGSRPSRSFRLGFPARPIDAAGARRHPALARAADARHSLAADRRVDARLLPAPGREEARMDHPVGIPAAAAAGHPADIPAAGAAAGHPVGSRAVAAACKQAAAVACRRAVEEACRRAAPG